MVFGLSCGTEGSSPLQFAPTGTPVFRDVTTTSGTAGVTTRRRGQLTQRRHRITMLPSDCKNKDMLVPIVTKKQAPATQTYPHGVTLNIESFLDLTMYPFYEIDGGVRNECLDGMGVGFAGTATVRHEGSTETTEMLRRVQHDNRGGDGVGADEGAGCGAPGGSPAKRSGARGDCARPARRSEKDRKGGILRNEPNFHCFFSRDK